MWATSAQELRAAPTEFLIMADPSSSLLSFDSQNDHASETVLLIHGAGVRGIDWQLVVAHLPTSYHLLIPDLFTDHSMCVMNQVRASSTPSWRLSFVSLLIDLIRVYAHGARAHVVGLSLGASYAINLATSAPDMVLSLMLSGVPSDVAAQQSSWLRPLAPAFVWTEGRITSLLGKSGRDRLFEGLLDTSSGGWGAKDRPPSAEHASILLEACQDLDDAKLSSTVAPDDVVQDPRTVNIRIIAATRRLRWMPIGDSIERAEQVARRLSAVDSATVFGRSVDCRVYEAPGMLHWWTRQEPKVFAECIVATITGDALPSDHVKETWKS